MSPVALNTRGLFDPRWAYFARPVAVSGMLAVIEVQHPEQAVKAWDPTSDDPSARVFGTDGAGVAGVLLHYVGAARVQPNNDWRARKQAWEGQKITEHVMRIQLDLTGNTLPDGNYATDWDGQAPFDAGLMHVGDVVRVSDVAKPFGRPIDPIITRYKYVVRNISASSNGWVRTLLCDFIVNDTTPPGS